MIRAVPGPLIVAPETWVLVFNREASTWWASWLALGRYKHVRAYAYVPFLHVWVFYDVHLGGTDIFLAADGAPAHSVMAHWNENADLVSFKRMSIDIQPSPIFGFCVPAIKRLVGLKCVAMRPDALYRQCLRHGGIPFEVPDGLGKS